MRKQSERFREVNQPELHALPATPCFPGSTSEGLLPGIEGVGVRP